MTSAAPLVSVIMPCYNAAAYIEEAIGSVMAQTHPAVELIVVDDGSRDASPTVVERLGQRYPGRIRLASQVNAGPYPARNQGLRLARGDYVAFLDADDWWREDFVAKLLAVVDVDDTVALAYCGWQNVGQGVQSSPHVPAAYESDDPVAHFLRSCPWPIHAALIRRGVVDRLGGFSVRRFASMDYDFWLRLLGLTQRIVRVPEVLAFYRWHGADQISAVKWRQVLDALDAQLAFIREHPQLVAHLSAATLKDLTEGQVLRQAYRALWKRDLVSAQKLFRHAAARGGYGWRDLAHVATALLPLPLYRGLARIADRRDA